MSYSYDMYGWYCGNGVGSRTTDIAPINLTITATSGELRSNWTGHTWVDIPYVVPVVDTSDIKLTHWESIKQERDRRTQQGGYQVAGKWFHSDTFSRTQQMGLVMLGDNIPAGLQWKTMDGSFVVMTPSLAQQVFAAAAQSDATIFAFAEQLRVEMEKDPLGYVSDNKQWPVMFGE